MSASGSICASFNSSSLGPATAAGGAANSGNSPWPLAPPCGACRQILWEFCGDVPVVLVNLHGKTETYQLKDLLPKPFDASYL